MLSHNDDYDSYAPKSGYSKTHWALSNDLLHRSCSVVEDKISIALNVYKLPLTYEGPTQSEDSVRWILTMIALAAGDASVLCGTESFLKDIRGNLAEPWLQLNADVYKISG